MENDHWTNCKVQAWRKLDRTCAKCGKSHADIEFTFSAKGLPKGYWQEGQWIRSWHWDCLPAELKQWQQNEEKLMIKECQKPF